MPVADVAVTINGPVAAVFDLVTSARFWTRWHPATVAVGGVTERPFGLGDRIHERVRFGDIEAEGTWTVVEYDRPRRAVLRVEKPAVAITYTFEPRGAATEFRRVLEYGDDLGAAFPDRAAFDGLMTEQSRAGIERLKGLVESILAAEAAGIP
jgi:uncharacterized protein YndB with AHSA1/START domain